MRKTLTFILAGGRGERLDPLTRDRAKPNSGCPEPSEGKSRLSNTG